MAALAGAERSYALLADGITMTIRPAGHGDYEPVKQPHEAMSPDNLYFRSARMLPSAASSLPASRRSSRSSAGAVSGSVPPWSAIAMIILVAIWGEVPDGT